MRRTGSHRGLPGAIEGLIPAESGTPWRRRARFWVPCVPVSASGRPENEPDSAYTGLEAAMMPCRTCFCDVPKSADVDFQAPLPPKRTRFCVLQSSPFLAGRTQFCGLPAWRYGDRAYTPTLYQRVYAKPAHTLHTSESSMLRQPAYLFLRDWRPSSERGRTVGSAFKSLAYPFLRPPAAVNRTHFCAAPASQPRIRGRPIMRTRFCGENCLA